MFLTYMPPDAEACVYIFLALMLAIIVVGSERIMSLPLDND